MSIPENGHLPASASLPDHSSASDSDGELEADYYHPISSAAADSDSESDADPDAAVPHQHHRLHETHNGMAALDLTSDDHGEDSDEEDQEEEGVTLGEAAAARAFSEDEQRRSAPLPAGAAARIVDAMRGVEFPGAPPQWAGDVSEDQWVDRLRAIRAGRPN
ncbi:hypothetical protein PR202_ga10753 [Eleusine coracana subsp. coracana]|uniref:Uncharacterized protein n=1 Tax=Eleusine coracana subsp. coracana TaxID=191504 RepID=A0AAV5C7F3_ELECO|nr:hypothetical protein QOZ80_1AG0021260 [Eleusine coracana subsp. coracana]GJM94136.1 hypothetical protein PR202_ga10753 [Eleusine coracana subsp. coracana]